MTPRESGKGSDRDREGAFAVFYDAHQGGIEALVRWRIGKEMAEVDDVCTAVFFAAFQTFDVLRDLPFEQARAWLVKTTKNLCANVLRSRGRKERARVRASAELDQQACDPFDEIWLDALSDDGQLEGRVYEVLEVLSETHREVLRLELDGPITGREMATVLGTTEVAARLRLMRARRACREEYIARFGWPWADVDEGECR